MVSDTSRFTGNSHVGGLVGSMGIISWKVCHIHFDQTLHFCLTLCFLYICRRHLALQKLDQEQINDEQFIKKFHRNSKHEITAAEWAICEESQEYCAIATSQLIEVVTWRSGDPTLIHSLRAHTRVITDIDWHSKTPYLLASCSIDTFTHLWDLRDPKKPTMSLSAVCMCELFKWTKSIEFFLSGS